MTKEFKQCIPRVPLQLTAAAICTAEVLTIEAVLAAEEVYDAELISEEMIIGE